jgi:hypothetical protein
MKPGLVWKKMADHLGHRLQNGLNNLSRGALLRWIRDKSERRAFIHLGGSFQETLMVSAGAALYTAKI